MNNIQLTVDESGFCKVIEGKSIWGQGFDVWEAIGDAAHNMGCCVSELRFLFTQTNNQFEVQITNSEAPDVLNPRGWTTVYSTDSECVEDAKRQMSYIMSSQQTRAQYLHPTAIRLIRNGLVNAAFVGSI